MVEEILQGTILPCIWYMFYLCLYSLIILSTLLNASSFIWLKSSPDISPFFKALEALIILSYSFSYKSLLFFLFESADFFSPPNHRTKNVFKFQRIHSFYFLYQHYNYRVIRYLSGSIFLPVQNTGSLSVPYLSRATMA